MRLYHIVYSGKLLCEVVPYCGQWVDLCEALPYVGQWVVLCEAVPYCEQ